MDTQISHRDQYMMLREEIMQHMREANRTELWGIAATGAVYAWLIMHGKEALPAIMWFISPAIIMFSGLRVFTITRRMMHVAKYLRHIEESAFGDNVELPGWERHLDNQVGHFSLFSPAINGVIFWTITFLATLGVSWLFSR